MDEQKYVALVHRYDGRVEPYENWTVNEKPAEWWDIAADEGEPVAVARRYVLSAEQPDAPKTFVYEHAGRIRTEEQD